MKWRVWYEDESVNSKGIIPALQCAMPSEVNGENEVEAAQACARIHGFKPDEFKRTYICVPADQVKTVTLRKDDRPRYEPAPEKSR